MIEFEKIPVKREPLEFIQPGFVILYRGKKFVFERIQKGTKSIHVISVDDNKHYKISLTPNKIKRTDMFNYYFDVIGFVKNDFIKNDVNELNEGDLFVFNDNNNNSLLLRFVKFTPKTIIAVNPLDNMICKINRNNRILKIENLPF